jgi:hypothetical protein
MKLFGIQFGKNNDFDQMEIRFHKQANHFGEHGRLNATHVKQGLVEYDVRFVIVGVTTPPKMDKNLFVRIWEEARAQGYTPHYLAAYGTDNEIASPTKEAVDVAAQSGGMRSTLMNVE